MKKIGKKLSAILFVALCCVLLFPITAMAVEPAIMPDENELTGRFYLDGMNPTPPKSEPIYLTIQSDENGHFSFDYPPIATSLGEYKRYYFSGMHIEGVAYESDGSSTVKFDNRADPYPVSEGLYFGKLDVNGLQATLTVEVDEYMEGNFSVQDTVTFTFEKGNFIMHYDKNDDRVYLRFNMSYREEHTYYEVEDRIRERSFELQPIDFTLPGVSNEKDTVSSSEVKGEWEFYKPEGGGWGWRKTSGGSGNSDHAGPLATITISILAILLSILFGNTGGFIPTVPVGTGGAPAPAPAGDGLSRWLRFDGDGDIETTDPVNGQRRTFVQNGDGTYTDPVSGATYTPEELSEQLEHRADNSDTIRQDEAQFEQNVREDRARNQERSDESRQLEEDLQRERQERSRKEKVERVATDLGMSGASEKQVIDELKRRMERDEEYRQKMHDYAKQRDTAVDILEATVEIADYTMAAGEAVVPGGKTVSATYKGIKNIGSTMMEKGASWGSFTEGAIKGGTEAATTMMKGGIGKAGVSFGGTVAGEVAEAVNDGGDLTEALAEGAVKGTLNAASGAVGDAYGDMVGGTDALNKAAETAGKLGEVGFEKNITGNAADILRGKDK
jgi:FKBP-type peptidyl-prolyl cis-trans isomerase